MSAESCPLSFTCPAIRALHHPFQQHSGDVSVRPLVARSEALHHPCHQHGGDVWGDPIVARCEALHHPCHHHGGDVSGDPLWARCESLHRSFHQHGGDIWKDPIVARCEALHHQSHHHGGDVSRRGEETAAVCAASQLIRFITVSLGRKQSESWHRFRARLTPRSKIACGFHFNRLFGQRLPPSSPRRPRPRACIARTRSHPVTS